MCNRYTLVEPTKVFEKIAEILGVPLSKPDWIVERYNVALTQLAPAIINRGQGAEILPFQFGILTKGTPPLLNNARSETAYAKRSFKSLVPTHRAIVPASGFIDWRTEGARKIPFHFTLTRGRPMGLAALWSPGDPSHELPPGFVIVTTAPNELVASIHTRMPVILPENKFTRWLDPAPMAEPEFLEISKSFPSDEMKATEVSDFINSSRNEGPECLGPPKKRDTQLGLSLSE